MFRWWKFTFSIYFPGILTVSGQTRKTCRRHTTTVQYIKLNFKLFPPSLHIFCHQRKRIAYSIRSTLVKFTFHTFQFFRLMFFVSLSVRIVYGHAYLNVVEHKKINRKFWIKKKEIYLNCISSLFVLYNQIILPLSVTTASLFTLDHDDMIAEFRFYWRIRVDGIGNRWDW